MPKGINVILPYCKFHFIREHENQVIIYPFTLYRKRVEYLMKTDDDMYINLAKLNAVVRQNRKPTLLMGSLICNAVPIKV